MFNTHQKHHLFNEEKLSKHKKHPNLTTQFHKKSTFKNFFPIITTFQQGGKTTVHNTNKKILVPNLVCLSSNIAFGKATSRTLIMLCHKVWQSDAYAIAGNCAMNMVMASHQHEEAHILDRK